MKQVTLYTGGGVSLSPIYKEGRTISNYVRIVADNGKVLTDGEYIVYSVDVLSADINKWEEIDEPTEEEPTAEELLNIIMGEE